MALPAVVYEWARTGCRSDRHAAAGLPGCAAAEAYGRAPTCHTPRRSRPQALQLLNQLLFAPLLPAPPQGAAVPAPARSSDAAGGAGGAAPAAGADGGGAGQGRPDDPDDLDGDLEDLYGPDLSQITPPPPPHGLGLGGDLETYYSPSNSLLDCVIARRRGLPITLALLHMAVGRATGLDVQVCESVCARAYVRACAHVRVHARARARARGHPFALTAWAPEGVALRAPAGACGRRRRPLLTRRAPTRPCPRRFERVCSWWACQATS